MSPSISISPEEIPNSSRGNENPPRRYEIKLRKNEMKLPKNEIKVRKNEMKLRKNLPISSDEFGNFLGRIR